MNWAWMWIPCGISSADKISRTERAWASIWSRDRTLDDTTVLDLALKILGEEVQDEKQEEA